MEWIYKSGLYNYIQADLTEKQIEILNYLIDNVFILNINLIQRNDTCFIFNTDKKVKIDEVLRYLQYVFSKKEERKILLQMRKSKIKRIVN